MPKEIVQKPSERIREIAQEVHDNRTDSKVSGHKPRGEDYILAIIRYLDEIK